MVERKKAGTRSLSPPPTRGRKAKIPSNPSRSNSPAERSGRATNKQGDRRGRSLSPARGAAKSVPVAAPKPLPPSIYDYGTSDTVNVPEHDDDDSFYQAVIRCIPSEFVVIASQDDVSKAQEDWYAMDHFSLKPPEGKTRWMNSELAGSVATCALLQLMQENPDAWVAKDTTDTTTKPYSTLDILQEIQQRVKKSTKQDANPTITSSRPLGPPRFDEGVFAPYYIVPPEYAKGTRRALLIACVSGEGEKDLKGTINDVQNIRSFLLQHCGFKEENMTVLQETYKVPAEQQPTKKNIIAGFKKIIEESKPGDVNFIQFSGHGNRSNTNLYILPSDYKQSGYIQDDRILKNLIKAMPGGVYTSFLCDCCYSGTIGDLPYILKPDSTDQEIEGDFDTTVANQKQKRPRPKPKVQQSIRTFYDTDTREETLAKEAKGDEDYKRLRQSRKQKTTWMLFEPHKLHPRKGAFSGAAKKAYKGAKKGANSAIDGLDNAIEFGIEAAKRNARSVGKTLSRAISPTRGGSDRSLKDKSSSSLNNKDSQHSKQGSNSGRGRDKDLLEEDDTPAPKNKVKSKAKTTTSISSTKSAPEKSIPSKVPVKKTNTGPPKTTVRPHPKSTTPSNTTRKAKPHIRQTRSSGDSAAPTVKPKASGKKQPMGSKNAKDIDEEEENREFEQAIAKSKKKGVTGGKAQGRGATSKGGERGRSKTARSPSPPPRKSRA